MKQKEYGIIINWNYIGVSVAILAVFTLMVLYMPNFRDIDLNILNSVRHVLAPYPSQIPAAVCAFGYANAMMWPQIAACCVLISHRHFLKAVLLPIFVYGSCYVCSWMKNSICRERPDGADYPGFSFPSCHAVILTAFLGIVIYLVQRYVRSKAWRITLTILLGLWWFMVMLFRLWLGVHFLSDVIAGCALGFIFVNLYIILIKSLGD